MRERLDSMGGEAGMTFPEMLVAIFIGIFVVGASLTLMTAAQSTQPRASERAAQLQEGRTMAENLVRELRQGESITSATSTGLQVLTHVNSQTCGGPAGPKATLCQVTYACTTSACTRTERNPDGTGTAPSEQVVRGISSPGVFTYSPSSADPTLVDITLRFSESDGSESVTISDGAALRNYFEAGA